MTAGSGDIFTRNSPSPGKAGNQNDARCRAALGAVDGLWLGAVLLLALIIRVALAWIWRDGSNSDVGIVALMAKHVAEGGTWPVFFYGQAYMGSAEPLLSALMCRLFGVSGFSVNLGTVFAGLLLIPVLYAWGRDAGGRVAAIAASLFAVVFSYPYTYYMIRPRGGYALALACIGGVLWLTARIVSREASGKSVTWRIYASLGLVAGLGWWTSQMVLPALLAAAAAFLTVLTRRGVFHKAMIGTLAFFIGSCPWWFWNAQFNWDTFSFLKSLGAVSAWQGTWIILSDMIPQCMGFQKNAWSAWWAVPSSTAVDAALRGIAATVGVLAYLLLAVAAVRAAAATSHSRESRPEMARVSVGLVLLYLVVFVLLACRSHFVAMRMARYVIPIIPAAALLMGIGMAALWRWNRMAAAGTFAAVLLFQTQELPGAWKGHGNREKVRELAREISTVLPAMHVQKVYGDYRLHWLNFQTDERVTICNLPTDRVNEYERALEMADHPGILDGFGGADDFVHNSGGKYSETNVGGLKLMHDVRPPHAGVEALASSAWESVSLDGKREKDALLLNDHRLGTFVSVATPSNELHEVRIQLREPQSISRVRWVTPNIKFYYPDWWQMEGRETRDGPWIPLGGPGRKDMIIWSGPRFFWARAGYRAQVDFPARRLCEIRMLLRGGSGNRYRFAVSEIDLFSPAITSVDAPTNRLDTLMTELSEARVDRLYCGRWEANQVAARSAGNIWTPRETSIWERTAQEAERRPDSGWLPLRITQGTAMLVLTEDAPAVRGVLDSRFISTKERTIAPWTLFLVDPSSPVACPTSDLVWSGYGVLYAAPSLELARRWPLTAFLSMRTAGVPGDAIAAVLAEALEYWPDHPGLLQAMADVRTVESAADAGDWKYRARQTASPQIPFDIRFKDHLRLVGVTGLSGRFHPGEAIPYRLFWGKIPSGARPAFFVHIRDGFETVCQDDAAVAEGQAAERCHAMEEDGWIPSQQRMLHIPENARAGKYRVIVGIYNPESGRRQKPHTRLKSAGQRATELPCDFVIAAKEQ